VHLDGARFANALAFIDCHPRGRHLARGCRRPSFGATKNGALAAEAVVFFDSGLVRISSCGVSAPGICCRNRATSPRSCWRMWKRSLEA